MDMLFDSCPHGHFNLLACGDEEAMAYDEYCPHPEGSVTSEYLIPATLGETEDAGSDVNWWENYDWEVLPADADHLTDHLTDHLADHLLTDHLADPDDDSRSIYLEDLVATAEPAPVHRVTVIQQIQVPDETPDVPIVVTHDPQIAALEAQNAKLATRLAKRKAKNAKLRKTIRSLRGRLGAATRKVNRLEEAAKPRHLVGAKATPSSATLSFLSYIKSEMQKQ